MAGNVCTPRSEVSTTARERHSDGQNCNLSEDANEGGSQGVGGDSKDGVGTMAATRDLVYVMTTEEQAYSWV